MTLFDFCEVAEKGTIKKIKFMSTFYRLEEFIFANLVSGLFISPEEFTIKSIYPAKNEQGVCVEVDLILDEERKNIIKKIICDDKED